MREIRRMAIEDFGRDHWSAFAYLETRCVDHRGHPDTRHMRADLKRHPGKGHLLSNESTRPYPTRLRDGTEVHDHDDWDCVDDLEAVGLVRTKGTGTHPRWALTERGAEMAARLRAHLAHERRYATFDPSHTGAGRDTARRADPPGSRDANPTEYGRQNGGVTREPMNSPTRR